MSRKKKIRVLVNGSLGKMGQETIRALEEAKDLQLVAACDAKDNLKEAIQDSKPDVAVDFTHPLAVYRSARTIIDARVAPVIGTTGLTTGKAMDLQKLAKRKRVGGVIAPNFALGILLMNRFAEEAVKYLPDVEVIEMHHDRKADAPSGTAAATAGKLRSGAKKNSPVREMEWIKGARGAKIGSVRVHSVRLPGLLAHQQILFGGPGQVLTLRHDALHREAFMPGVLLAVRKAPRLKQLVYGLENLLW